MKKIAVITASIGSLELKNPTQFLDQVDYHAFVTKEFVDVKDNWIRHEAIEFSTDKQFNNRRNAKLPKILPQLVLPGYEYYIWIDCTNELICDPQKMIDTFLKDRDIACFVHTVRSCAYAEIDVVIRTNLDELSNMKRTKQFLLDNKFPKNYGLPENTCRIQRNTPLMLQMGLMWWELICRFSSRDQVTLPYVFWKLNIDWSKIPGKAQGGNDYIPFYKIGNHKRILK